MTAGWYNVFIRILLAGWLVLLSVPFGYGQAVCGQPVQTGGEIADGAGTGQNEPDAEVQELTELWTGSLYTSAYRAGLCIAPNGDVRGVLHLKLANGEVSVYHFYGELRQDRIEVSHSSGHVFKGHLASEDAVEGMVRLKNGMRIRMEGKRIRNVRLAPSNCAPLPQ